MKKIKMMDEMNKIDEFRLKMARSLCPKGYHVHLDPPKGKRKPRPDAYEQQVEAGMSTTDYKKAAFSEMRERGCDLPDEVGK